MTQKTDKSLFLLRFSRLNGVKFGSIGWCIRQTCNKNNGLRVKQGYLVTQKRGILRFLGLGHV